MQDEEGTPIKQDVKKGKPRFYHEPIPWNYGMLPQATRWPARCTALCLILSGATTDWLFHAHSQGSCIDPVLPS